MWTLESLRHRNPSKGLPLGSWVKIPPDHRPFGNPWPRWLTLTPSSQIACSPFEALIGLLSLTICSTRSEEHTSELQSLTNLVCRLLLEKKKKKKHHVKR